MEHVARSLNPHQTLVAGSSAAHMVATAGLGEVLASFEARIGASVHAIYRVRRITPVSSHRPGRPGITSRSVQTMCTGSRDEMAARLADMPGRTVVGADGIARDRTQQLPRLEEFYVACPAVVDDKARPQFEEQWYAATTTALLC